MPPIFQKSEPVNFRLNGRLVNGYRWNAPASRKFLILHGFESSAFNFDRYVRPMVRKGYEVVAMDAPAHGRSEGKTIAMPDYIRTIEETEKRFGPFDAYLAHSFGGLALSLFLEGRPDKKDAQVVLIAPATETTTAIDTFFRFLQLAPDIRAEFEALIRRRTGHGPDHFSIGRIADLLPHKVLWVHDEEDDMTPLADVEPVRLKAPPNIRFLITRGLGHRRIYRDTKVSQEILAFFDDNAGLPGK
jgi:alpha-beta hydrolase superfamily lysophospholipase